MEKNKINFESWLDSYDIKKIGFKYYTVTSVDGWTKKQLLKIYNKELKQP